MRERENEIQRKIDRDYQIEKQIDMRVSDREALKTLGQRSLI